MFIYILMYLSPYLFEREGMKNDECLKPGEVSKNETAAPVEASSMFDNLEQQQKKAEEKLAEEKKKEPENICVVAEKAEKGILDFIEDIQGQLNKLNEIISRFDPIPADWRFRQQIQEAQDILDTLVDNYKSGEKQTYELATQALTRVDQINQSIKKEFEGFLSTLQNVTEDINEQMTILAEKALQDGIKILNEINQVLSIFKKQGTINVDLLAEYDRIYDGTGIAAQNAEIERQKQAAKDALAKSTAETANLIKEAQNPGFFMSMLESIIYIDPTSNPNFVYKTEKPANPALEQARQIVYYIAYAVIVISIIMFLSTKTFVMPFLQTFIFWFKRYFVFLAWIIVVGLIYVFMTNWFTWIIRENVRYMAFVVNPLLHPGVHQIWHSKYKYWIKILVYGLASMAFFVSAIFFTAVILFLIAPLFLLLLWASGQLMSYFEKEELDE